MSNPTSEVTVTVDELDQLRARIAQLETQQLVPEPLSTIPDVQTWSLTVVGTMSSEEVVKWHDAMLSIGVTLHNNLGVSTFDASSESVRIATADVIGEANKLANEVVS